MPDTQRQAAGGDLGQSGNHNKRPRTCNSDKGPFSVGMGEWEGVIRDFRTKREVRDQVCG